MLVCPVRGCQTPLMRIERRLDCARGHSFDLARSGYVNLLQPQDKKSKEPGDTSAAIAGRRRLHDLGVTLPLLEAIAAMARAGENDVVLDAGCGEGFYLGSMHRLGGFDAHGVDISIPAIDAAARRYPECEWVVANADRQLPYAERTFTLLLSITARMNAAEFRRVLRPDGRLLVAIPAPEDLSELRGGSGGRQDRVERTVAAFEDSFALVERKRALTVAALDAGGVADARHAIYMPPAAAEKSPPQTRIDRVTFALDLLLFRPR